MNRKNTTLVLCIDRDDDIGRKVRIPGPIVGWRRNTEAAQALALVDPEDADVNAIFGAVKIARELDTEVATLTGDAKVGIVSDKKISEQLDELIKKIKPDSVILVSDGAEDEQLIPIIQSRVKIDSIRTIVVRQSKELEKAYFTIINFVKEVREDPNMARLFFALPGLIILLLSVGIWFLGFKTALMLIGIILSIYLILIGVGIEEYVYEKGSGFVKSLSLERVSTLIYFIGGSCLVFSILFAYDEWGKTSIDFTEPSRALDTLSVFILSSNSIDLFVIALTIGIIGRIMDVWISRRYIKIRKYLILLAFIILVRVVVNSWANFWGTTEYGPSNFILSMAISAIAFFLWIKVTEYLFTSEIESIHKIINDLGGKEVYTTDGKLVGKVSKVLLDGSELVGVKVGKKKILKDQITSSTGNIAVVNLK